MIPSYTNEAFHVGDNRHGERIAIPADVHGTLRAFMDEHAIAPGDAETVEGKWWCRLSAPGYMDATDWDGPFDTVEAAREAIEATYDVDPDTGDDLDCEGE